MTDAENSDDERYANESFENESDAEVPEMSEFESETTENSDDDEDLPSVKVNTGPINRNGHLNSFANVSKTDVVPFDSSSEEEDEVIVGQTLVEINTPSMLFEKTSTTTSVSRLISFDIEDGESSEEIVEEDDEEEEELKKIKEMEEKYLQQISAETNQMENLEENQTINTDESQEDNADESQSENDSDSEDENDKTLKREKEHESEFDDENVFREKYPEEQTQNFHNFEASSSSEGQYDAKDDTMETLDQTKLLQLIQSSLTNLKISSADDKEDQLYTSSLSEERKTQTVAASNIINTEQIAMAVVNALKSVGLSKKSSITSEKVEEGAQQAEKSKVECNTKKKQMEIVCYKDDFEEEKEVELEKIQNTGNKDIDQEIHYDAHFDYRITSKTPTSFNSDDYILHANFIKPFYRTNSTDKLRSKSHNRKSMSFSNERMREIERHNQILLRKILAQKPTYILKNKPSQSSLQKVPSQTNARLTTSALNRKKQQRQIDLDNQVLKRKIEAIALRRRPFITWNKDEIKN